MQGVLFDLDGTLVDSLPGIASGVNHALAAHGHPTHPESVIRNFIGDGVWRTCRRASPADLPDEAIDAIRDAQVAYYNDHWKEGTEIYEGIPELLRELQDAGIPIAVCTNKPHHLAVATMDGFFPELSFTEIFGESKRHPIKPNPASALDIAKKMGLSPNELAFVGDSMTDFNTAKNAGMQPLLVTWGYHDRPRLKESGAPLCDTVATLRQSLLGPHPTS